MIYELLVVTIVERKGIQQHDEIKKENRQREKRGRKNKNTRGKNFFLEKKYIIFFTLSGTQKRGKGKTQVLKKN